MALPEPNIESPGWHGYSSFVAQVFCLRENRFDQQTKEEGKLLMLETILLTYERLDGRTTQALQNAMQTGDQAAVVEMALR